jgi:hypothetical protein
MVGFNLSSFDGQTQRGAAHLWMIGSFGKSEPAFGRSVLYAGMSNGCG